MAWDSEVYLEDIRQDINIPTRSRLFALEPIGAETPEAEGLISYIVRLAGEHGISPRLLIRSEFIPLLRNPKAIAHPDFFSDFARTLHGTGDFARKFVDITEQLTSRRDLMFLTTLPWLGIVPSIGTGFMTRHPKWCKACLAGHRANKEVTYLRLSWAYALYEVCLCHLQILSNTCAWCGKHQPFLPYVPDLSRCAHCFGWLGTADESDQEAPVTDQKLWIAGAIENMIITAPNAMGFATGDIFRSKLTELVNTLAHGQKTKFSTMVGMTPTTMAAWITKQQKPLLPQFLYLCRQLGMMPSELLLNEPISNRRPRIIRSRGQHLHKIKPRKKVDAAEKLNIAKMLLKILNNENDHRPLTEISNELGATRKYLIYWFSDSCHQISLRYRQNRKDIAEQKQTVQTTTIRDITWHLNSNGQYPSNRKVAAMIAPLKLSLKRSHLRQMHRQTKKSLPLKAESYR